MENKKQLSLTLEYIIILFLVFLYLKSLFSFLARVNTTQERITGVLLVVAFPESTNTRHIVLSKYLFIDGLKGTT